MAETLGQLLEDYGKTIVTSLQDKIKAKGLIASAILYQSIKYRVKIFGKDYVLHIGWEGTAEDYAKYADEGRRGGKPPPFNAILKWVQKKGLVMKPKGKGKWRNNAQMHKSLAYLIQQSIKKKGTIKRFGYKGSNFWGEVFTEDLRKELTDDLRKYVKRDIQIEFSDIKKQVTSHGA